ncbi:obscurin-like protein 1a [Xiphias gladius]|uniref:obscurin-like protein 1a n=1 Tax=Xiphias gladius TaxID=8245 RepID=UPI001A983510|nr:obscurin-like protein 1a [Xiphias gladius]XP_039998073.1 obscurin-like protein 1a [Xiphias gladius]XP_039998074.1 obscurin-like protein 1a [Xiphias gladius]XP_039998075.1 obscurin-like protein 1a [Xiphias gladius]
MDIFGGAPRVLGYPRPVVAQCGTDATLRCQIDGDPHPDVIWERKNVQILSEGRYKLSEEGKAYLLTITGVTQEDVGQYICKARNSIGETYAAASLKVEGEAQPQEGGQRQLGINGVKQPIKENGEFEGHQNGYCKVQNGEQRKENGTEIEGEHKLNSKFSEKREEVDLTSDDKPRFLIKPLSLRVDRGEDAAFSCKLWGTPLPEVTWEKDGKKLNDIFESSHFSVTNQDGGWFQLKIYRTRMQDKGVYICKAINCHGEALAGAVLLVEPVPEREESKMSSNCQINSQWSPKHRGRRLSLPRVTEEPNVNLSTVKKFAVAEGKHAKFRCFVTGKPKPEIIWKKDRVPLEPGRRHLIFEDREGYYTLKVLYCKEQDTGLYVCAASNALGNTLSAVHLSVKGPAVRFRRPLKDVEVRERDVAVLECEVPDESVPAAWYLEDQRLMPSSKYGMEQKGTKRRLTIHDVGTDDDGVYLCEMPDGAKSIAELSVKGTIVRKLPRKLEVLEGENAAFCVEVEDDDMEVHWFKDGLKLHETHQTILKSFGKTHILVFVNVAYQDSGVVTFVAGRSKTSSRLKVKASRHCPPICPVGVKMDVDRPNSALLTWVPAPNSQTSTRSIFVLERQEVGSQEWQKCFTSETATSAEVAGDSVPCEGDYRFRVCCINKYGRSGHVEFPKAVHLVPGPKIHSPLQGCEVMEGEDACFSIELSSSMVGTWFLNSAQLQHGGRYLIQQSQTHHSLVIHETRTTEDTAEVTFIANGVRDSAVLKVKPAVVKFSPLSELDSLKKVETGDAIVLYCEVSHPFAKVSWFKDGEELQITDGLNIQSDGNMRRIVIQSADVCHSGVYTCETSGDVIKFNVDVAGPPVEFSQVPEEELHKSSMELDPVVLFCHVSREDAEVMWYKDGCEIQPNDNITLQAEGTVRRLIIRSAETSDAGSYTCQAGNNSMEFIVNVREPPVMIVEPKDDVVMERYILEEIHLQCELSRSSGKVQWFKDGQEVEKSDNIKLISEGPYRRLTIFCGSVEDGGEYVCKTDGDSVFFQLTVTEPPVRIVFPSESELELAHLASERLELSCEISQSDAPVRWYRDGLEVEEGPNLILEVNGARRRLVIPTTTVDDTGEYVCDTEDDSVAFLVTITEPPVKLTRPRRTPDKLESFAGKPIVMEIEVSRPSAEVKWWLNGKEVEENSNVTITEDGFIRRLTIHVPTPEDSGKYTCDAVDDKIDFQVKVSEPPVKILRKSEIKTNLKFLISDDIVLECELSRHNAVAKWYKDGCRIEDDERFCEEEEGAFRSLVILNAELRDSGEYILDVGDDNINFQVTVEEPPVTIVGNSIDPDYQEMLAGDELILACELSRANAPVQWYCNDRLLTNDSRTYIESYGTLRKIIISNVQPSDSGKYVCDAMDDKMICVVRIQEPPVIFVNKEDDIVLTGYEAESVTMMSYVSKESALVCWLKDWTPVEGERFQALMEGHKRSLTIEPLRRSDAGEYTCDVNTDQIHFSLLVKEMRIKFLRPLQDTVAHADSMVTLRCEVCKPKADVQWLKNGVEMVPSRRFSIRADGVERSLTIHRLTREDAGEYVCESKDDRTVASLRVEMPRVVEFLTDLHNTTVLEGEDATFKCVVSPEDVQLVWLMDNEAITPGDRFQAIQNGLCHTLVIKKCQMLDCSKITAEAEGKLSKASLKVQEAQVMFTKKMDAVMAEEFGDATLETEISLETGEVQWMRQGVVIQPGPRHTLAQNGCKRSLTIQNLTLSDRGTYRCETLHDRTQVKLNVEPRKISIRKGLTDQETCERETASFEVELSHTEVEGIWQKDGIRVKPNNQWRVSTKGQVHSLTLSNLTLEDTGTIVFSAEGVRTAARLTVKETPVSILRALADVRVEEEFPATLECEFSRQNVEVRWLKSGTELKPGKNCRIYSMGRKRFCQILQCSRADSGTYTCDTGEINTSCSLEVYEHDLEIVQHLEDLYIQEDHNAVFMCEVSLQDVTGEWYKDGHKIRPSNTIKIRTEGSKHFLLMCNVKAEDAGEIRFVARDIESTAYLAVEELPVSIVKPLRDRTALEKHRVILECTVSSPRCSATWYKDGEELVSSDRVEMLADDCCHKLVIRQVAVEDEGTYGIEVGEHTSKAKLMVEAQALVMVKELEDVEVTEPEPASFQCEVSVAISKPPMWTLNGETLKPGPSVRLENHGTVHKLTLRNTSADMSGMVKFTMGKAKSTAMLSVMAE